MTWKWSASGQLTKMGLVALLVASSACASNPGRYAHQAPPPDRQETAATLPGPEYSWGSGQSSWDGDNFQRHVGGWAVPPTGYYAWTAGGWQQSGTNNWVYVEGHWQ